MKLAIEIVACLIMLGGVAGIFIERIWQQRGIGIRIVQFLALVLILPMLLILALEKILSGQTAAALFGVVIGYVLAGIGRGESHRGE